MKHYICFLFCFTENLFVVYMSAGLFPWYISFQIWFLLVIRIYSMHLLFCRRLQRDHSFGCWYMYWARLSGEPTRAPMIKHRNRQTHKKEETNIPVKNFERAPKHTFFFRLINCDGKSIMLGLNANIVTVAGSITALGCDLYIFLLSSTNWRKLI